MIGSESDHFYADVTMVDKVDQIDQDVPAAKYLPKVSDKLCITCNSSYFLALRNAVWWIADVDLTT